jgi:hypothetical protein
MTDGSGIAAVSAQGPREGRFLQETLQGCGL